VCKHGPLLRMIAEAFQVPATLLSSPEGEATRRQFGSQNEVNGIQV
jgi:hypothetical protein